MKKKAQNLIEFIIVMPLLIILIFGIIEIALFWRTVHTVQNIALQAAANAATQLVIDDQTSDSVADLDCTDGSCFNLAVAKAVEIVQRKQTSLALTDMKFSCTSFDEYGEKPYTLYECDSDKIADIDGHSTPQLKLIVDYRDPYKKGIIMQLIHQYRTIFMGASFALPTGKIITLIPRDIEISSTKIQQYNQY